MDWTDNMVGAAIGTAVGDALGLPREGLRPEHARAIYGQEAEHAFWRGKGVLSDDTEHTVMTLKALAGCDGDPDEFRDHLARELRWWLLSVPLGIGFGTLRALIKSWVGFRRSGVASAGNGPAMRSAVTGLYCAANELPLEPFVRASTELTHSDDRALEGAMAVARCAQIAVEVQDIEVDLLIVELREMLQHPAWEGVLRSLEEACEDRASVAEFAVAAGMTSGVSGYIVHSVPASIYAWMRHPKDPERAINEIIAAGGDSDSTAAVTGALVGAGVGSQAFPERWVTNIIDWPVTADVVRQAAHAVTGQGEVPEVWTPYLLARNAVLFPVVVLHILRHLAARIRWS